MTFHMWRGSIMRFILRGRRSIWWSCRVTFVAPRIVNDVSYVTRINHEIHFAWQAQYLVKLECHFSWQAQHFVQFWEIAGAPNVVFFHTKCVSKMGRVRSPKRRVRDDDFILGLCSDYPRITWRIIPVSKWLITMVSKSPKWGYSPYKWPKWLVNRGY